MSSWLSASSATLVRSSACSARMAAREAKRAASAAAFDTGLVSRLAIGKHLHERVEKNGHVFQAFAQALQLSVHFEEAARGQGAKGVGRFDAALLVAVVGGLLPALALSRYLLGPVLAG